MDDWIIHFVQSLGLFGVALLMFGENLFPPLPSEFIMPLAGFLAATGEFPLAASVAVGTVASLLGTSVWYAAARNLSRDRMKRWLEARGTWLAMEPRDLDRSLDFFGRHGKVSVLLGRMVPFIRTVISVPAGLSRMKLLPFLVYSVAGIGAWTAALAIAGWLLGQQFPQIREILGPVTWVAITGGVAWYIWRVVQLHRRRRSRSAAGA